MTSTYLAGPYAARDRLREFAADLDMMLVDVTSSWLKETHEINSGTTGAATALTDEQVSQHALDDLDGVAAADLLVLITAEIAGVDGTSGGRHVETGFALGLGLPVVVVGKPENVFHRMGEGVCITPYWQTALGRIASIQAGDSIAEALS